MQPPKSTPIPDLGTDPETGQPFEPAKDPLSLDRELTPEEEADWEQLSGTVESTLSENTSEQPGSTDKAGPEPGVFDEKGITQLGELVLLSDRGVECLDMVRILNHSGFNGGEIKRAIAGFWGIQTVSMDEYIREVGALNRIFSQVLDSVRIMESFTRTISGLLNSAGIKEMLVKTGRS